MYNNTLFVRFVAIIRMIYATAFVALLSTAAAFGEFHAPLFSYYAQLLICECIYVTQWR